MPLAEHERELWCRHLADRIDRRVETLMASDPGWFAQVRQQARQQAVASLGLETLHAEWDRWTRRRRSLDRQARRVARAMLAVVRRVPLSQVRVTDPVQLPTEVAEALQQRQSSHETERLAAHPQGREVLRLRREKEELHDTVWLATVPPLQRLVWQQLSAIAGAIPTAVQQGLLEEDYAGGPRECDVSNP